MTGENDEKPLFLSLVTSHWSPAVLAMILPWVFQCHPEAHLEQVRYVMGTLWQMDAIGPSRESCRLAIHAAFAEIERLDGLLSDYRDDSEISRINRAPAGERILVSQETAELLALSQGYAALTDGAFDVTVRPLVALWGFKDRRYRVPGPEEIEDARRLVGREQLSLDVASRSVRLASPGVEVDLGAIGKGYAVDRAMAILKRSGVVAALIDAGGTVAVWDERGRAWKIGIEDPEAEGRVLGWVALKDQALATSGNYLNRFVVADRAYGHLLDPRTGYPVDGAISASVVAERAVDADALATSLCVLGPQEGLKLLRVFEGVHGLIATGRGAGRRIHATAGFARRGRLVRLPPDEQASAPSSLP